VITQFLGHIVRGEPSSWSTAAARSALHLHRRRHRRADEDHREQERHRHGKIYNIGNPANNYSVRELAEMMLRLAKTYPEYAASAGEGVSMVETTAAEYYGKGYQDVQNRVPKITNTFLGKVSRTSVLEHYGLRTLLYGTLLPAPDIGARAGGEMRATRDAGFEVGIHCHDHFTWQDFVAHRDAEWTANQMQLAVDRFRTVFGGEARTHGAAGWQMNDAAFALEEKFGFAYASDTRGTAPFVPFISGRRSRVPQLPTTLPTLDELIGLDGVTAGERARSAAREDAQFRCCFARVHVARRARGHEAAAGVEAPAGRLVVAGTRAGVAGHAVRHARYRLAPGLRRGGGQRARAQRHAGLPATLKVAFALVCAVNPR
jgi:hypothetical protein